MDSKSVFNRYEFFGILVPGASLLLGLWLLFPEIAANYGLTFAALSIGALGVFTIAAFCTGHVIQAPANLLVDVIWNTFGRPTERMRFKGEGLADEQVAKIPDAMNALLGFRLPVDASDAQWRAAIAAMASLVTGSSEIGRLQEFNGKYGLHRGLTAALALLTLAGLVRHNLPFAETTAVAMFATGYRMRRFSRYYARELWVEFLALSRSASQEAEPAPSARTG